MEKPSKKISIENIVGLESFEQWVQETFPGKKFSTPELTMLSELVRKAKKLDYVEKELERNKDSMDMWLKVSDEHVEFYKDQLKVEQKKGEIGNMVKSALGAILKRAPLFDMYLNGLQ